MTDRLEGLYDEPRPIAKRTITDEQVEQVIIRRLETTPRGATHWSTREMAKAVVLKASVARSRRQMARRAAAGRGSGTPSAGSAASAHRRRWRRRSDCWRLSIR
jgi:hypothetical protein